MRDARLSRRGLIRASAIGAASAASAASAAGALTASPSEAAVTSMRTRPGSLRVATFNIHHGAGRDDVLDLAHTAEVIEASGADIVALQEVDRHFRDRSDWQDQAAELARMLSMRVAYGANIDLDPLKPEQPRRQYGTTILVKGALTGSRNTWLPKYDTSEQRGLLEVIADVRGMPVRVATTHMQHTSDDEWQEQADAIMDLLAGSAEPVILTGDTNAVPEFPGMRTFTDAFTDIWAKVGVGDGLTTPPWRFDYILVPKNADVRQAWLISTDASDHLPLVVDLVLPPKAA